MRDVRGADAGDRTEPLSDRGACDGDGMRVLRDVKTITCGRTAGSGRLRIARLVGNGMRDGTVKIKIKMFQTLGFLYASECSPHMQYHRDHIAH